MSRIASLLLVVSAVLVAVPAAAESPADVLARLRGTPSTDAGPLGSAFPKQYVDAYRFTPRPRPFFLPVHHPPIILVPAPVSTSTVSVGVGTGGVWVNGTWTRTLADTGTSEVMPLPVTADPGAPEAGGSRTLAPAEATAPGATTAPPLVAPRRATP